MLSPCFVVLSNGSVFKVSSGMDAESTPWGFFEDWLFTYHREASYNQHKILLFIQKIRFFYCKIKHLRSNRSHQISGLSLVIISWYLS